MKAIDYFICTAKTVVDLQNNVNEKIAEGYQPFGTIVIGEWGGFPAFVQTVVRYV